MRSKSGPISNGRGAVIGLVGGLFSGLLGIGGGTVMVPLLVLGAKCEQRLAHAMSLVAVIPISFAAVLIYGSAGEVDPVAAVALSVGAVFGAWVGATMLARAPERVLKAAFGVFMLLAAALIVANA